MSSLPDTDFQAVLQSVLAVVCTTCDFVHGEALKPSGTSCLVQVVPLSTHRHASQPPDHDPPIFLQSGASHCSTPGARDFHRASLNFYIPPNVSLDGRVWKSGCIEVRFAAGPGDHEGLWKARKARCPPAGYDWPRPTQRWNLGGKDVEWTSLGPSTLETTVKGTCRSGRCWRLAPAAHAPYSAAVPSGAHPDMPSMHHCVHWDLEAMCSERWRGRAGVDWAPPDAVGGATPFALGTVHR